MLRFLLATALAAGSVSLSGVPASLVFPLPSDANAILTADVPAGSRQVWLATAREGIGRVMLTRAGDQTWQVNLASPVVAALLASEDRGGEFRVYAEGEDGTVAESVPVHYRLRGTAEARPGLVAVMRGTGEAVAIPPGQPAWVAPGDVARLEVRYEEAAADPAATATVGGAPMPLDATAGGRVLALEMTPDVAASWADSGLLTVRSPPAAGDAGTFLLRAIPSRLDLPAADAVFSVEQRSSKVVPGTRLWLRVRLSDITGQETRVAVETAEGDVILPAVPARAGARFEIGLREDRIALVLTRVENLLVGEDYAIFTVSRAATAGRGAIDLLLDRIRESGLVFLLDGEALDGPSAATRLAVGMAAKGEPIRTPRDFIGRIPAGARVRLPDGTERALAEWVGNP